MTKEETRVAFDEMVTLGELAQQENSRREQESNLESPRKRNVVPTSAYDDRDGYDPAFLGKEFVVESPTPKGWKKDIAPVSGRDDGLLAYTHFSLMVSKSRRLAIFTAVNIDGKKAVRIKRSRDHWVYDERIHRDFQIGNELYAHTNLDRGHLVRREDPVWGTDAEKANTDTFHFTNCSPQHEELNERIWLGLENYILANVRTDRMRVSVFTGPILAPNDPVFREVQIPRRYWKVIAFKLEGGRPSATGYVISQAGMMNDLEYVFGSYKTYQVPITMIESLSRLQFGSLSQFDGYSSAQESTVGKVVSEISRWQQIRV